MTESVLLTIAVAVTGCGRVAFDPRPSDASARDDAGCTTFGPWSNPILRAELSTDSEEYAGTLSRDGTTVIFPSDRPGGAGSQDLYMATRSPGSQTFSSPMNLAALNSAASEEGLALSDDQLTLYFMSNRAAGVFRIYTATRASPADDFGPPTMLAASFTGLGNVGGPDPTPDGLTLYFDADAGGVGVEDLWMITRATTADPWSTPTPVPGVNTAGMESEPIIDEGGLTLYYITDAFEAPADLVIATRPDLSSPFGPPTKVPLSLNPGVGEYGGDMSADRTTMELSIHLGAPLAANVWLSTRSCQ